MTQRAHRFLQANRRSPVVYGSVEKGGAIFYRLADGTRWTLRTEDRQAIVGQPHWAHELA
jgi:hypothetical protein